LKEYFRISRKIDAEWGKKTCQDDGRAVFRDTLMYLMEFNCQYSYKKVPADLEDKNIPLSVKIYDGITFAYMSVFQSLEGIFFR